MRHYRIGDRGHGHRETARCHSGLCRGEAEGFGLGRSNHGLLLRCRGLFVLRGRLLGLCWCLRLLLKGVQRRQGMLTLARRSLFLREHGSNEGAAHRRLPVRVIRQ